MPSPAPTVSRFCLFATALAAFYSLVVMVALLCFLQDAALAAVPFGDQPALLGREFFWTNLIAVLLLIIFCATLGHALARIAQITSTWRQRKTDS